MNTTFDNYLEHAKLQDFDQHNFWENLNIQTLELNSLAQDNDATKGRVWAPAHPP